MEAQTASLPVAAREAAVAQALTKLTAQATPGSDDVRDRTALPHELGHLWFIRTYWPDRSAAGGHYGGPAPDWFDEVAAVLMEDDASGTARRDQFAATLAGTRGTVEERDRLLDLQSYLSTEHPALPGVRATAGDVRPGGGGVRVLTGPEAQKIAADGLFFYLQSRRFADYLIERTGNPAVFGRVADAIAAGGSFADWLSVSGYPALPTTLDGLAADWRAWALKRQA